MRGLYRGTGACWWGLVRQSADLIDGLPTGRQGLTGKPGDFLSALLIKGDALSPKGGSLSLLGLLTLGVVIRLTFEKTVQNHKWQNEKPADHIKPVSQHFHFGDCLHFDRHTFENY